MHLSLTLGEVADRLSILEIKACRLPTPEGRARAKAQAQSLRERWAEAKLPPLESLGPYLRLQDLNLRLWEVEDQLRDHERRQDFGVDFVTRARQVYLLNDRRAAAKRALDLAFGDEPGEDKSHALPEDP
jgi:hypothetical protein